MARIYDISWENPHEPGPEEKWQESDWFTFYDPVNSVGGVQRIGHKPNQGTAQLMLFAFIEGGERVLINGGADKRVVPLAAGDRTSTRSAGGTHYAETLAEGMKRFGWDEPETAGELEIYESFYTPRYWTKLETQGVSSLMAKAQTGGKLQHSGRLRGWVRVGKDTRPVDAFFHRDRAWGFRDLGLLGFHRSRLIYGSCGPAFSLCSMLVEQPDGSPTVVGFVVREGIENEIVHLRMAPTIDQDGYSVLGATAWLKLDNGEDVRLTAEGVQGCLTYNPEAQQPVSDTLCRLRVGELEGMCNLIIFNNPGRGTYCPSPNEVYPGCFSEGLSPTRSYGI